MSRDSFAWRAGAAALLFALAAACSTEVSGLQGARSGDDGGSATDGPQMRTDGPRNCPPPPATRRQNGQACTCADECASGFCVDGVCCNNACTGTCRACNVATSVGTCTPLPAGMRPVVAGQCRAEPVSTCGFDGTCDGSGNCRKWPDGTECAAGRCMGASVVGTMVCTGGACRAGPTTVCSPFSCDPATNKCYTRCTSSSHCDGRTCANGSCGRKPLGATCAAAAECESGFCADGVCCNLACTGACVSCNQPGAMGACTPVPRDAPDPHNVCKKEGPETCGSSGLCNGQGGCAKYAAGTVCRPASCSGGSQIPASTCNGLGSCVLGSPINCFPYACTGGACKATCASDADCAPGSTCRNGSCGRKGLGQRCAAASECRSNFCVDGVCCDAACTGTCSYCAFPNALGRCTTVPAGVPDPRNRCEDRGPASCGTNGRCNGAGACQLYATGTVCRAESCDAATNRYTEQGVCRNGSCATSSPTSCAPYRCNGSRCGTSCSSNDQCVAPVECRDGSCGKRPNGALCARADECVSGFCAQGVCCGTACTASCFSCNLPGSAGSCQPVPAGGDDPTGSCKDEGAASCGNDGTCNGMGACRKYGSGTICAAASCTSGTYTAESKCNGTGTCERGEQRSCSPYRCNAGGTACYTSCTDDGQCVSTRRCEMGMCGRKENGAACTDKDECQSGFCVNNACCNSACTGVCRSCAVPGSVGTCSNIPNGSADDDGGCAAQAESTCGNDGFCNGMGACRKWGTSTVCRAASCPANASTLTKEAKCDGMGTCPTGMTQSCGNYRCEPATNMCKTTCSSDADCISGKVCDTMTGSCGKSALGARCTGNDECASGHCVDNTCCGSASCGECQTCANAAGTCQNVANDMPDPDSCSDQTGTNPCGTTGKCNGMGKCKLAASGTQCGNVCSADGTSVVTQTCNGNGMCSGTGTTTSCNGFVCTAGSCATTCEAPNKNCVTGKLCLNGTCQDAAGG